MKQTAAIFSLLCLAIPNQNAIAGGCYKQAANQYVAAYVAPVKVLYYVGREIRHAAVVEAEKAADPEFQAYRQWKADQEKFRAYEEWKAQQAQPPQGPLPQQARQTVLQQRCVSCHSGPDAADGRDFSGPLTAADVKAIKEVLPTGRMPKPNSPEAKGFSNELAGQVILDAIDQLTTGEAFADPPPLPPPQEELQPPSEP